MRQNRAAGRGAGEKTIRDIRRATRRQYSAEEKIRIVLDGLRGEDSIAEPKSSFSSMAPFDCDAGKVRGSTMQENKFGRSKVH